VLPVSVHLIDTLQAYSLMQMAIPGLLGLRLLVMLGALAMVLLLLAMLLPPGVVVLLPMLAVTVMMLVECESPP
jgi:hypothetical protein